MTENRTLVLIPARMAATRLPGKPLLDIAGLPMIVHVLRSAEAAAIGRVAVATDTAEIAEVVKSHGGEAVMTRADHPSGSDRIYEALGKLDPGGQVDIVVNLQGDFPTIRPDNIRSRARALGRPRGRYRDPGRRRSTPRKSTPIRTSSRRSARPIGPGRMRALYFTRAAAPYGDGPRYHHIGLYAYRRAALERFVGCRPRRWSCRKNSNSSGRSKPGCGSTSPSSRPCRAGSTPPPDLETARGILAKS